MNWFFFVEPLPAHVVRGEVGGHAGGGRGGAWVHRRVQADVVQHLVDGWDKLLANLVSGDAAGSGLGSSAGGAGGEGKGAKSKRSQQDAAKAAGLPLDLEVDFKVLYTAITRCRNRLVVCETGDARQSQ